MSGNPKHADRDSSGSHPAQLMSIREVADLIRTSERWIWREVSAGRFPRPRKLGALSRWESTVIERWIDDLPTRRGLGS